MKSLLTAAVLLVLAWPAAATTLYRADGAFGCPDPRAAAEVAAILPDPSTPDAAKMATINQAGCLPVLGAVTVLRYSTLSVPGGQFRMALIADPPLPSVFVRADLLVPVSSPAR